MPARGTRARVKFFNDGRPAEDAPTALEATAPVADDMFSFLIIKNLKNVYRKEKH